MTPSHLSVVKPLLPAQAAWGASNATPGTSTATMDTPSPQGSGQEVSPEFGAVLAALVPQRAGAGNVGPLEVTLQGDSMTGTAALDGLAEDIGDLTASVIADPGQLNTSQVVTRFLEILQQFDMATGASATQALVMNLNGLDPEGLSQLDAISENPVLLLAALSEFAGVPKTEGVRVSILPVAPKAPAAAARVAEGPMRPEGEIAEGSLFRGSSVAERAPVGSMQGGQSVSGQGQPNSPASSPDARGMIMAALVSPSDGAQPDAAMLPAPSAEARPVSGTTVEIARPAEPAVPPPSGFARNLSQQIRSASFTEGQTRIALAPRGLGEIEIDMLPDEAGKLRIVLRAENPAVLQALRGDRDGLLLALADGGANVEEANLDFEDFSQRHRRNGDTEQVAFGDPSGADAEDAPSIATPQPRLLGTGALDILT